MRARPHDSERVRRLVVHEAADRCTIVRCDRCTTRVGTTLPGFNPGFAAHEVLERTRATEMEDIIEPAGAFYRTCTIGSRRRPPFGTALGRAYRGRTFSGKLPVTRQLRIGDTFQPEGPPDARTCFQRHRHVVAVQRRHLIDNVCRCIRR